MSISIAASIALVGGGSLAQDGTSTKDDPLVTPWVDPEDPTVFRMNEDDPSFPDGWRKRNDKPKLVDLLRNCSALLTWYFTTKEKHHGIETNPGVPRRSSSRYVDQRAAGAGVALGAARMVA